MKQLRIIFFFLLSVSLMIPSFVSAARVDIGNAGGFLNEVIEPTGLEQTDVSTASGALIQNLLQLVGLAFLILMVYGGFLWMNARGDEGQIDKARTTVTAAVIGLSIVVGAFAITSFVTSRLIENSGGTGPVDAGNVGDQQLGCCVIDIGSTYACRIDTQVECDRRANRIDDGKNERQWIPNMDPANCSNACQ